MYILFKKHITERNKPKNLQAEDKDLFKHEFIKHIDEVTITSYKVVCMFNGLMFSLYNLKFFSNFNPSNSINLKQKLRLLLSLFLKSKRIKKAVWIIDNVSLNYFHWFTDALPRLLAAEKFLKGHLVLLPKEYKEKDYVVHSLKTLKHEAFFFELHERLLIFNLIIPGYTAPTGNYNKEIINLVRKRVVFTTGMRANKKIYISRQKVTRRKITNEDEVIALLQNFNFEIHYFEDYHFKKQMQIAEESIYLISIHGAGLTNMLFMPEGGKILELRKDGDSHNNCYFSLASDLKHDYYYLICKGDNEITQDANLTVDITKLKNIVQQMISS